MFNKIVASVISSVVLFACNTKEESAVNAADVVAESQNVSAPEVPKTEVVVQSGVTTLAPSASTPAPSVSTPVGEAVGSATPLAAPVVNVGVTGSSVSTSTPASTGLSTGATSAVPVK